jgi:hypothetical protein
MTKAEKFAEPVEEVVKVYPQYEAGKRGIRVRVSQGMYLPGEFGNELQADRAYAKYLGKQAEATARRKTKKKATT